MANNKYCGTAADYQPVSEDQSRVVIMYGMKEDGEKAEWYQLDFYKKQGKPSFEQAKASIIADINEHITEILETTKKLISTQEHADEMDRAANIDALTKVRNKRAYVLEIERVDQEIRGGKTAFGLAMIDLNYLKMTNDTYGHERGNEALRMLCGAICRVFKHSPVFRIGGDEFVVVLENSDYEQLDDLKEAFEQELRGMQNNQEPWARISAAAGYALFDPSLDADMESVFKRADQRMYERKKAMKAERT